MAKIAGPFVMPDANAAMIGRIADAWAQLEFQVDRGIWTLLRAPQQFAACLTSQMLSIHPRMKAFIALVEIQGASAKTIRALNKIYGEMGALSEARNRAVHDPRLVDYDSKEVYRLDVTARPKPHFGFIPENLENRRAFHDQIYEATTRFSNLRDAAIAEIEALPLASRPPLLGIVELREASVIPPTS
jgi:hypothetical protein